MNPNPRTAILEALSKHQLNTTANGKPVTVIGVGGNDNRASTHAICRHPDGTVRLYKHTDLGGVA